jgi:MYXO-CTERM domain-containing protein
MRNVEVLAAGFVGALCAFLTARPALACECLPGEGVPEYVARAGVVFEGQVEDIDVRAEVTLNRFRVLRYWKGALGAEVVIITDEGDACEFSTVSSCAEYFTRGETYLVFANYEAYCAASTSLCMGTSLASQADDAFTQLGSSVPPGSGAGPLDDGAPAEPADDCEVPPEVGPCPDAGTVVIPQDAAPTRGGGGGGNVQPEAGANEDLALQPAENSETGCGCRLRRGSPPWSLAVWALALLAIARRRPDFGLLAWRRSSQQEHAGNLRHRRGLSSS